MNSNERVRALLSAGLRRNAVAAIFGIETADVKTIQSHPTDAEEPWTPGDERAVITEAYNVVVNADPFTIPLTNGWVPLGVEFGGAPDYDTEVYGSEGGVCSLLAESLYLVSITMTFSANLAATARLILDTDEFNAFNSYNFPAGVQFVSGMFFGYPMSLGRVRPKLIGANGRTISLTEVRVVRLSRRNHRPA